MTNFEYIKENLTELDLAYYEFPNHIKIEDRPDLFSDRVFGAYDRWASGGYANKGNQAAGDYGYKIVKDNPSIWSWEKWYYPDGSWRKSGRNRIISFQVWLNRQYDPNEWD